ncbi:MAG: NTE family protein [Hyphomicrobiaceae bacterium]|jgi:NTE family protein
MSLTTHRDQLPDGPPRIGLALGGGGARGLAHVLVLEVLDELGIRPSVIAGTSIGALIGSAYAAGMSGARIRAHLIETLGDRFYLIRQIFGARSQPIQKLLNVLPMRSALLDPIALLDLVLPAGMPEDIAECEIPFRAIATDMRSQQAAVFGRGNLKHCVAASIAIPVLFAPVAIDGEVYADGGLVNPLPLDIVAPLCDITIGIDVTGSRDDSEMTEQPSVTTMLVHSVAIFQKTIIREHLKTAPPDVYLDLDVGQFGALQFNRAREILEAAEPFKNEFRQKLQQVLNVPPQLTQLKDGS